MRKKFKELMEKYGPVAGPVAVVLWFAIFFIVLGAFALVIRFGFRPEGVAGEAGVFTAAYLATKATQPLRAIATVALTPVFARLVTRLRKPREVK
jgi:uncharacterized membrane protein HdeD (DUF308 family)